MAFLARLWLSPDEEQLFAEQLDAVLGYFAQLSELDTSDVPPTSHVVDIAPPFRDDEITNPGETELLLSNAPERHGSFFKVPKIIE